MIEKFLYGLYIFVAYSDKIIEGKIRGIIFEPGDNAMADKILHKIHVYKRRYIRWRAGIEKRRYLAWREANDGHINI